MITRLALVLLVSVPASVLPGQGSTYTNSIGMEFVLVQPGAFTVGRFQPTYAKPPDPNAPPAAPVAAAPGRGRGRGGPPPTPEEYRRIEEAALRDYRDGFRVSVDRPFYIGKFEVTQAQYQAVMGVNPSTFKAPLVAGPTDTFPVETVTWAEAQSFVRRLNARERTTAYRLATEFEWELAARAGADDDIAWSERRTQAYNAGQTPQAVGKLPANGFGLHDMLGNTWEWVEDFYNEKLFADPVPPASGREHVLKGGSFTSDVANMSYTTHAAGPANRFDVGFRVVMVVR